MKNKNNSDTLKKEIADNCRIENVIANTLAK